MLTISEASSYLPGWKITSNTSKFAPNVVFIVLPKSYLSITDLCPFPNDWRSDWSK